MYRILSQFADARRAANRYARRYKEWRRETSCATKKDRKLTDCKPVSVPFRAAIIPLDRTLLSGSSSLPGSLAGRAVPPPLFGLAPRGVFPASEIASTAVRSYRTISPLPRGRSRPRGGIFSVALSVSVSGPRPLAGTPPCGDRTFLPRTKNSGAIARPSASMMIVSLWRRCLYGYTPHRVH
jgi:hypothetical protein